VSSGPSAPAGGSRRPDRPVNLTGGAAPDPAELPKPAHTVLLTQERRNSVIRWAELAAVDTAGMFPVRGGPPRTDDCG